MDPPSLYSFSPICFERNASAFPIRDKRVPRFDHEIRMRDPKLVTISYLDDQDHGTKDEPVNKSIMEKFFPYL